MQIPFIFVFTLFISIQSVAETEIFIIDTIPVSLSASKNVDIISYIETQTDQINTDESLSNDFSSSYDPIDDISDTNTQLNIAIRTSTSNVLEPLMIFEYYSTEKQNIRIDSVAIKDLNRDQSNDLIIDISREADDFSKETYSYFFIQDQELSFSEVNKYFPKKHIQYLSDGHIRVNTPISPYGSYFEEKQDIESTWFPNHFLFKGSQLISNNDAFLDYYETLKNRSKSRSLELIRLVKGFDVNLNNIGNSQYELNEYFQEISNHKIIIARCEDILYD